MVGLTPRSAGVHLLLRLAGAVVEYLTAFLRRSRLTHESGVRSVWLCLRAVRPGAVFPGLGTGWRGAFGGQWPVMLFTSVASSAYVLQCLGAHACHT